MSSFTTDNDDNTIKQQCYSKNNLKMFLATTKCYVEVMKLVDDKPVEVHLFSCKDVDYDVNNNENFGFKMFVMLCNKYSNDGYTLETDQSFMKNYITWSDYTKLVTKKFKIPIEFLA